MKILFLVILSIFQTNNAFDIAPPGTVLLANDVYIDKNVVSVIAWKEYVQSKERNSELAFYPDTSIILKGKNYYNSNEYNNSPIKHISFEAVEDYIKWRESIINNILENYSKKTTCKSKFYKKYYKKNIRVKYKIATKEELKHAKNNGIIEDVAIQEFHSKEDFIEEHSFRCVAKFIYK